MVTFTEIENRKKSLAMTTGLFLLLFLLFFLLKFSNEITLPELEGGGGGGEVAVNFGDSDFGSGDNFQSTEKVVSAPKQTQPTPTKIGTSSRSKIRSSTTTRTRKA